MRTTYKQKVLSKLQKEKVASRWELAKIHARFGASILELRKAGFKIDTEFQPNSTNVLYRYGGWTHGPYVTQRPTCPNCGAMVTIHDVRKEAR